VFEPLKTLGWESMANESVVYKVKTPSGKIETLENYIKCLSGKEISEDIRKMLVLVNNAVRDLAASKNPMSRSRLEYTYGMLIMMLFDSDEPLPVKKEVKR